MPASSKAKLVGPAETIENDAVFNCFGAVFDRLGAVFDRKRRRNEAFKFDSNCQAPQRAWQFESNSNAKNRYNLFVCSLRSKIFSKFSSRRRDRFGPPKSSNFEPSSRFFGHLKILNSKRRRNEAFEFDSSCRAPQRALQLESNSNATV